MRKMLLVLDYAIELGGGFFMVLVVFVGNSILYQRVLFCAGTFLYGVPIPVAYLLNESRVRNIIVNDGWMKGIKSIFDSNNHIRDHQRMQVTNPQKRTKPGKNEEHEENGATLNGTSNPQLRENQNIIPEIAIEYNPENT